MSTKAQAQAAMEKLVNQIKESVPQFVSAEIMRVDVNAPGAWSIYVLLAGNIGEKDLPMQTVDGTSIIWAIKENAHKKA